MKASARGERRAFRCQRQRGQSWQECGHGTTRAAASAGSPVQHVQAHRLIQRELAAAGSNQRGQISTGPQPFTERIGQRADVIPGRAHQTQPQPVACPLDDVQCRGGHLDRIEMDRLIPTCKVVGTIAVYFLCRVGRRPLEICPAKLSHGRVDHRLAQIRHVPGSSSWDHLAAAVERRRLTPSSISASYSFSADDRNCASLVARPRTRGSTPDARGSRAGMPASWPTFCRIGEARAA